MRKHLFTIFLLLFICLTLTCCVDNGDVTVPSKDSVPITLDAADFDDRLVYDGAALAKTVENGFTNLTFTREDENGNAVFTAVYRGKTDRLTAVEYSVSQFDSQGRITSRKSYGLCAGKLAVCENAAYEYGENTVTRSLYNPEGTLTEKRITEYTNDSPVSETACNSAGLLTFEAQYGNKDTETGYIYEYGILKERRFSETEGTQRRTTVFSADNELLYLIDYTLDENGNILIETRKTASGDIQYTQQYTYSGGLVSASRTDADGTVIQKSNETTEDGANILRETTLFENGNVSGSVKEELNSDSGIAKRYIYDKNGTLTEYSLFEYSCAIKTKESIYNYTGGTLSLLTEREFSDITADLSNETRYKNGELIISREVYTVADRGPGVTRYSYDNGVISHYNVFLYDKNGNELSDTLHDASGNPVSKTTHSYRADGTLLSEGGLTYTAAEISEGFENTFNEDGSVASEITLGEGGKTVGKLSYTYTDGVKTGMSATGEDSDFLYRETYEYNESGLVSLMHRYTGDDTLILITGYDYAGGVLFNESTYEYENSGTLVSHTETTYSNGKVSTINKFNAVEILVFSSTYTYTADGRVLVKEYSYTDSVMTKDVDRVFDSQGNPLEYTERTGWGELVTSETYTVPLTEPSDETEVTETTQPATVIETTSQEPTTAVQTLPTETST